MKKFVEVTFDNNAYSKNYVFKNDIEGLVIGDKVVVETANGFSVGTIKGFLETSKIGTKYVVQKIDLDSHKLRLEKEKKLATVKAKMEARRKQLQEIEIYKILAKEDSEMATLLSELENLN
ncbi:hypothetical protein ORN01_25375 [Bacillus cereus]|uniref:hypothetical protein n=1 Tax=Bacillus cereus group TaxID=86661 RepID=UPI0022DFAEDC|nr:MULTISPECIES: hypothetical protein [Bacillus cereus group]MDA1509591.1 hypothetical protein [Bacillus cereus group sp. TH36-2LC]MDZ4632291.1 hypothetical protein [Bacillus cereus]